ncbi:MAG: pro-sigmaK processing inhibitor BofA family protein [Oscillospiraceae bacterium]|nr:pro-sigmaK processing inhibitor BofA family protein [Oscillospiraceae bacterium]
MEKIILGILIVLAVMLVFKLFSLPIRLVFRILINTAAGFVLLLLFNYIGMYLGLSIGINIINALLIGILGIPGLLLLVFLTMIG